MAAAPEDRVPAGLVGKWRADAGCAPRCTFTLTWKQNPIAQLDAITMGMALRMDIEAAGRFRFGDVSNLPPVGEVKVEGRS